MEIRAIGGADARLFIQNDLDARAGMNRKKLVIGQAPLLSENFPAALMTIRTDRPAICSHFDDAVLDDFHAVTTVSRLIARRFERVFLRQCNDVS
jgi:hypothetical protein